MNGYHRENQAYNFGTRAESISLDAYPPEGYYNNADIDPDFCDPNFYHYYEDEISQSSHGYNSIDGPGSWGDLPQTYDPLPVKYANTIGALDNIIPHRVQERYNEKIYNDIPNFKRNEEDHIWRSNSRESFRGEHENTSRVYKKQNFMPNDTIEEKWNVPEPYLLRNSIFTRSPDNVFGSNNNIYTIERPIFASIRNRLSNKYQLNNEFNSLTYTAATCDASEFFKKGYNLRQGLLRQTPRKTELFIIVTLYDEDDILLGNTLKGIYDNIEYLSRRQSSKTWGRSSWKKIVVCVVADGRQKINPKASALLESLGVYQPELSIPAFQGEQVQAHIYEHTTKISISAVTEKGVVLEYEKSVHPTQMILCLKEKNLKKINSHRWCFQALAPIIKPRICVLIDSGTRPDLQAVYHLWRAFDRFPNVGGACGEIRVSKGKASKLLLNPLVAAQNFEYKISNFLDKPTESVFGYISVLPGAFSAYRYCAIQNDINGIGPLEKYYKGEILSQQGSGVFAANMYLAEDRVLTFELVAKRHSAWLIKYVSAAHAWTDVPDSLSNLILQRRRWLNGSFFAAIYAIAHSHKIIRTSHSVSRKAFLIIEFIYLTFRMLFAWFGLANYFLVARILTSALADSSLGFKPGETLSLVFLWLYGGCVATTFVISFGNKPKGTEVIYLIVVIFFALLMLYLSLASIFITVKSIQSVICNTRGKVSIKVAFTNPVFRDLIVSLSSTYVAYVISSLLFLQPWHMITSFFQYLLISPSYINVMNVYAFCNIHDISWGTRDDTSQSLQHPIATSNGIENLNCHDEYQAKTTEELHYQYEQETSVLSEHSIIESPIAKKLTGLANDTDYYAFNKNNKQEMKAVIQRVKSASVTVDSKVVSAIGTGLMVLVGVSGDDTELDIEKVANKILKLRLWASEDDTQPWKRNVNDINGEVLMVSQFTLFANVKKGTKPDFHAAAKGEGAKVIYDKVLDKVAQGMTKPVQDGVFGAMMDVALVNDGPVTIQFDTKETK
ncbi:hypothetical protein NADFUDRAFT_48915 [Nadsonia fulvescens var. elongata DSM 6958]|uniref:D-aminoacyl-tRNA deacylase n=1 Tax=Nadsonia fulvescens var. elongata DSM 6958 TaxID=857566 RepID=A0A1E3PS53_9ASCO|nr:hypothetical protein NADFUDRAFT_48915 [Nadsonia fulvescens var. elongata DSM 6958]